MPGRSKTSPQEKARKRALLREAEAIRSKGSPLPVAEIYKELKKNDSPKDNGLNKDINIDKDILCTEGQEGKKGDEVCLPADGQAQTIQTRTREGNTNRKKILLYELERIGFNAAVEIKGSDKVRALEIMAKIEKMIGDEGKGNTYAGMIVNINKTYDKSMNLESAKIIDVIAVKSTNNEKP